MSDENLSDRDRVALVIGGNRDIGGAISRRLSKSGVRVALTHCRDETAGQAADLAAELGAAEGRALALQLDAHHPDQIKATVDKVVSHFGRIDILVNNAAVAYHSMTQDFTLEQVDETLSLSTAE